MKIVQSKVDALSCTPLVDTFKRSPDSPMRVISTNQELLPAAKMA